MNATTLTAAANQWAKRQPDERRASLQELFDVAHRRFKMAKVITLPFVDLHVEPEGADLRLLGQGGPETGLSFTDYSFKQLSRLVGLQAHTLSQLPSRITADALNFGINRLAGKLIAAPDAQEETVPEVNQIVNPDVTLLYHVNGSRVFRAITSPKYERIWNWEVAKFLLELNAQDSAWRVPPARPAFGNQPGTRLATEADVLDISAAGGIKINVGDPIAPGGLYEASHDMFAFLINTNRSLEISKEETLYRGFFVRNSEVGNGSLVFTLFYFCGVCSNHYVYGARNVAEINFRHVGDTLRARVDAAMDKVRAATDASVAEDAEKFQQLRTFLLGDDKMEVLETVTEHKFGNLPLKTAQAAYALAEEYADISGDPKTAYGFTAGLTRLSQQSGYADSRTALDRIGGKILRLSAGKAN